VVFADDPSDGTSLLNAGAAEEIFQIAREAIKNAALHANAHTITVRTECGIEAFTLQVHDDGDGLPQEVLEAGAKPMHWGLPGMRERAKALKGRLSIYSSPYEGTRVELVVPARLAYA
jgi:signal transduction histidine kinase